MMRIRTKIQYPERPKAEVQAGPVWSAHHDALIWTQYQYKGPSLLAKELGRTTEEVVTRAHAIGYIKDLKKALGRLACVKAGAL